jgi:four helix bundle protein
MEPNVQSYQDLIVWQRGMDLTEAVYRIAAILPREELYGLTSQMQRAAVSIPANIAEGWGRQSTGDYIRFLRIAQGSAAELETELLLSIRLRLVTAEATAPAMATLIEVRKMLRSMIGTLQRKVAGSVTLALLPILAAAAMLLIGR